MIIPRLLECLEVPNIFLEVAEVKSWSVYSDKDNKSHIYQPDFKTYIVVKSNVIPSNTFGIKLYKPKSICLWVGLQDPFQWNLKMKYCYRWKNCVLWFNSVHMVICTEYPQILRTNLIYTNHLRMSNRDRHPYSNGNAHIMIRI